MRGLSTTAGRDAWLAALLDAFEAASGAAMPVSARMKNDVERHLRDNARVNATASPVFH